MILRGRGLGNFRVDYSPDAGSITGIRARIERARANRCENHQIERMLQPLVAWNRLAFMDIPGDMLSHVAKRCTHADIKRYESRWKFLLHYTQLDSITKAKRTDIVGAIVESKRQRCILVDPHSKLLEEPPTVEEDPGLHQVMTLWSLFDKAVGFGKKLMACFDGPNVSPEEYEDRLEACLYGFKMANMKAIYG